MYYCTFTKECFIQKKKVCCHECDLKTTCPGACKQSKYTCVYSVPDRSNKTKSMEEEK